jgi:hypothetical protein
MSEKLFIESINNLDPTILDQDTISGLYVLLNSGISDKKLKQAAYDKINAWKSYKRKMATAPRPIPTSQKAETAKPPA